MNNFINSDELGQKLDLANYYWAESLFTDEEVKKIKEAGDSLDSESATTFGGNEDDEVRRGTVAWLARSVENQWIYEKLFSIIKEANDNVWNFELVGFLEDAQYATYVGGGENGDRYDYHLDLDGSYGVQRKISAVVQLTDEEEYEGGELQLLSRHEPAIASKLKGSITIFPSYMLHRVTPVTQGKRNSLVLWVSGYPFK